MAYKVIVQPRAEVDIAEAYAFIVERGAPEAASRWYRNIKAQIQNLADYASQGGLAPEAEKLGFEIRQVHYGKRTGIYRIIFRLVEESNEVHVLAVRHGARKEIEIADLD